MMRIMARRMKAATVVAYCVAHKSVFGELRDEARSCLALVYSIT
jgi:hypothetical protein